MSANNIVVRIDGGLGSQLFQYAGGYALAQHLGCRLVLETAYYERYGDRRYCLTAFKLPRHERVTRRPPRLVGSRRLQALLGAVGATPCHHYREPFLHFDRGFFELVAPVYLEGYFLSERYFAAVSETLRGCLALNEPLSSAGAAIDARIANRATPVSIHVRRGDLVRDVAPARRRPPLDMSYFRRADEIMSALLPDRPSYFIFSDEPDYANQAFDFLADKVIVRGDSDRPWEEMVLMSRCRHHITANSSFSWWAAWLNARPDKTVVAPRHWFTMEAADSADEVARWNAIDLYPSKWILL